MEESKEELKSLLMSVKEESEKHGLKLNMMYGESNMETYIATCKIDIAKVMTYDIEKLWQT